jgi:hypothetical protein
VFPKVSQPAATSPTPSATHHMGHTHPPVRHRNLSQRHSTRSNGRRQYKTDCSTCMTARPAGDLRHKQPPELPAAQLHVSAATHCWHISLHKPHCSASGSSRQRSLQCAVSQQQAAKDAGRTPPPHSTDPRTLSPDGMISMALVAPSVCI